MRQIWRKQMNDALKKEFIATLEKIVDPSKKVEFIDTPEAKEYMLATGVTIRYAFDYAIRYQPYESEQNIYFHFIETEEWIVPKSECVWWKRFLVHAGQNVSICLVSDKGFSDEALSYVQSIQFDLDGRLMLAKFTGDAQRALKLNRIYRDLSDPRGHTGIFSSTSSCSGIAFQRYGNRFTPVGLFGELGIPVREEYCFRCPGLDEATIVNKTIEVWNTIGGTNSLYDRENDYLDAMVKKAGLRLRFVEMGYEYYGEYVLGEKEVWLNRMLAGDENKRHRFTLAHELGHHYLHRHLLERYDIDTSEGQSTLELVGASNKDFDRFEAQANKFASNLLMPEAAVRTEAKIYFEEHHIMKPRIYWDEQHTNSEGYFNKAQALEFVGTIATIFRVSREAAKYRLINLGLLEVEESSQQLKTFMH